MANEKRLIDANALIAEYDLVHVGEPGKARKLIADAPTVDAVPVVRCKDCKWLYDEMDDYCCRSHRGLARICENSFCSYGERKDGDGNG